MRKRILLILAVICVIFTIGYIYRHFLYTCLLNMDKPLICRCATKFMSFDDNEKTIILLINALKNKSWGCRFYVMRALEHMDRDKVIKRLMEALKNSDDEIARLHIVTLLGKLRADEAGEMLVNNLFDDSELIRAEAAEVLGNMKYKNAIDQLYNLSLNDHNIIVRSSSALALAKIGDQRATRPLLNLLQSKSNEVKMNAILGLSLSKQNQTVINALVNCLKEDHDYYIRYQTIAALEKITNKSILKLTGKDKDFWLVRK